MMTFLEGDVHRWDADELTGQMRMHICLETVLEKLPPNRKIKICRWVSKDAVEAEYFPRLKGVRFANFLAMNFERTKSRARMLTTYANLLENLCDLLETYGTPHLNAALGKCNVPRKCAIEYVKTILKNRRSSGLNPRIGKSDRGNYRKKLEKAVDRFL